MIEVDREVIAKQLRRNFISLKLMHDCLLLNQQTYSVFCMMHPKCRFDEYIELLKTTKSIIDGMESDLSNYETETVQSLFNSVNFVYERVKKVRLHGNGLFLVSMNNLKDMLYNMLEFAIVTERS